MVTTLIDQCTAGGVPLLDCPISCSFVLTATHFRRAWVPGHIFTRSAALQIAPIERRASLWTWCTPAHVEVKNTLLCFHRHVPSYLCPPPTMRCIAPAAVAQPPPGTTQQRPGASRRQAVLMAAAARSSSSGSSSSSSSNSNSKSVLDSSIRLASMRAAEQLREHPLFADSYSAALVEAATAAGAAMPAAADAAAAPDLQLEALATRFLDEQLLKAVTTVNMERDLTQVGRAGVCVCERDREIDGQAFSSAALAP